MELNLQKHDSVETYISEMGQEWVLKACHNWEYNQEYRKQRNERKKLEAEFAKTKKAEFEKYLASQKSRNV